jgi:tRNA A-37 threonylcarbamoyl transferase component Bud32
MIAEQGVASPPHFSAILERQFVEVARGPFVMGTREELPIGVANRIVQCLIANEVSAPRGVLSGRGGSGSVEIEGLGRVFVKRYAHGGLLRRLTAQRFLSLGPARSVREFQMLEFVRSLGVNAPLPVMYVTRGTVFYATWLVMEELQNTRTLVELSEDSSEESARQLQVTMGALGEQLYTLIRNRVLHIDFHPGNVLVGTNGEVHIVDFDKARISNRSSYELRDVYLRRWRRAVIKHGLSPVLTELMSLLLRGYHD